MTEAELLSKLYLDLIRVQCWKIAIPDAGLPDIGIHSFL